MEKTRVDYHKLDTPKLAELVKELGDKAKDFNANDYVSTRPAETKYVNVMDASGKPQYYVGKDGKTKIRKQKIAVGTKTESYFNLMKAKRDFYKLYKSDFEWVNVPKTKTEEDDKKDKINEALKAMGVKL